MTSDALLNGGEGALRDPGRLVVRCHCDLTLGLIEVFAAFDQIT